MTVSLDCDDGDYQVLVEFSCPDSDDPSSIAERCFELLRTPPSTWPRVRWFPQRADRSAPSITGPGWRPG